MQVLDPAPVAKGLLAAAVCLIGIPGICRWIEDSVAPAHGVHGYPAIGISLLILMAATRLAAPAPSLPPPREDARRRQRT
jgi:hypothetical protein